MSNQTRVETEVMANASAMFKTVHDDLKTTLDQLMIAVESVRGEWQGRGGTSFQLVTQEWRKDQGRMLLALSETADAILTSGRGYSATDDVAAHRMNSSLNLPL